MKKMKKVTLLNLEIQKAKPKFLLKNIFVKIIIFLLYV